MENRKLACISFLFFLLVPYQSYALEELFIGGSPLSIDISSNENFAVISLHSPATATTPNLVIVDLTTNQIIKSHRIRLRMTKAVFIENNENYTNNPGSELDGLAVAALFGDQSSLTIINPETGDVIKDISTTPRPSNIKIMGNLAYITGSTTGDVNVINLNNLSYYYSSPRIGVDPRDFEIYRHSDTIQYAYVSLGGEKSIAVIEIDSTGFVIQRPRWKILKKIDVGYDPSSMTLNSDKTKLIVANLNGRSVNIFDVSLRSQPQAILNHKQKLEWPVGLSPTDVIPTSDPDVFMVANSNSYWLTQVDLSEKSTTAVRIKNDENLAYTALAVFDGKLAAIEKGPNANLSSLNFDELITEELPLFDSPGEPQINYTLGIDTSLACPGFYFAEAFQQRFASGGVWGKEIKLKGTDRTLQGGLILKSNFKENGGSPGYGGFNIANSTGEKQSINIEITRVISYTGATPLVDVSLKNLDGENILGTVSGSSGLNLSGELSPGFYYFSVRSKSGAPAGEFLADISTSFINRAGGGFQGGVVIGGHFSKYETFADQKAFAGFCVKQSQDVTINSFAAPTYGNKGASNLVISLANRSRETLVTELNTPEPIEPVSLPESPDYSLAEFTTTPLKHVFVDANYNGPQLGTSSRPYKSITKAITKTNSSNVVYHIRSGTYAPSTTDETLPIGSRNPNVNPVKNNVWIRGENPENTIIDAEYSFRFDGSRVTAMQISNVENVRISGLTIKNSQAAGIFINNSDNVRVDHNYLTGNARFGVGANSVDRLMIDNNYVVANSESGIVASASYISSNNGVIPAAPGCPELFGVCIYKNVANDQRADGILVSQGGQYSIINNKANHNGISGIEINNRYTGTGIRPELTGDIIGNSLYYNGGGQLSQVGTGILVTEFSHAKNITNNTVNNNLPGGIAVFEDSSATNILSNQVNFNSGNGIAIQKRSAIESISGNEVLENGLSGIFLASDVTTSKINSNFSNFNGRCEDCLDAKNGLAILNNASVEQVAWNTFNSNSSGVQVANNADVAVFENNEIVNNHNIGLFVRNDSHIFNANTIAVNQNTGDHAIFVSNATLNINSLEMLENLGEGLTISENGKVTAQSLHINRQEKEGLYLRSGGGLTLTDSLIEYGLGWGISATGENTKVNISNTTITKNMAGVIAQNGASILCNDGGQVIDNLTQQTSGNVSGCD
ncbi:right-handed parallel beta-helix repeat-containing protein [Marinicella sp. S1101]|uniref:right-handed parallel beta-helix repeat-containing protein n=1 Tax=Marinicella marina TaxID=2996016 RepID=UPI002260997A|nr:right-handed parallel beta-helix repeat-containing protein [Marinicella marina]MCX7553264.1 right-handed parallel beta-helix repeat-containing protein [Marinicella marina]MDJ1138996.1 right-handed parallel beta-helix repeat-containing protein [Marinicella marina]